MQAPRQEETAGLKRSKRLATIALSSAVLVWLGLMGLAKALPGYGWLIQILMLSAEAGVVGGLADWYAITVLFRNPFGKLPLPRLLRDHTEIIPRNKARIAESMGRFVQENFLSPLIVQRSMQQMDLTLAVAEWLAKPDNNAQMVRIIQQTVPKMFTFVGQEQISTFIQHNSVQWLKNTQINTLASEMLRAVLDNDFHQEVLQRGLDSAYHWVKTHPEQVKSITRKLFKELGVSRLVKGASFIGIDVEHRAIHSFIDKVEQMLADPDHPWRLNMEDSARQLMLQLADPNSTASINLNATKNTLLNSPQMLNFIGGAIAILVDAINQDLQQPDSGIAMNLQVAIQQLGENLMHQPEVRELLNSRLTALATEFSDQYSDRIIRYISERIHEWDSSEMIGKIENQVGGDLHMIRVNGVVVGAFIGLVLGLIRAAIEYLF